jgi:putative phage-type endonuclease
MKSTIRKGLTLYSTEGLDREGWLEFRKPYLGGSDMGTIMGVNKRFSATELFYQKLGLTSGSDEENNYMYWGKILEPIILEAGKFLNIEDGTYIGNPKLRNIRHFGYTEHGRSHNWMINNPEYPWLLANVDGVENYNNRWFSATAIVECKNISRQAAEMWETIPPYHFFQTQMYIRVAYPMLKNKRALLLYLRDGNDLYGYYIEESKELTDEMIQRSYDFYLKVTKGREIIQNERNIEKRDQALAEIAPEPDSSKAWEDYWSEAYKKKQNYVKIQGTEEVLSYALNYNELNAQVKELEERKQLYKNHILNEMLKNSADAISFGERGQITYNKRLYINIKEK